MKKSTYHLTVVSHFASAHTLRDYDGPCQRMHGHNWKCETHVVSNQLDRGGMAVDFKQIRRATHQFIDQLDHRYLNEIEPFNQLNPTAENIAAWLYQQLSSVLNSDTVRVDAITLWETDFACATYREESHD